MSFLTTATVPRTSRVMRVSTDGGPTETLFIVSDGFAQNPQLLPDGDSVLFTLLRDTANLNLVELTLSPGIRRRLSFNRCEPERDALSSRAVPPRVMRQRATSCRGEGASCSPAVSTRSGLR